MILNYIPYAIFNYSTLGYFLLFHLDYFGLTCAIFDYYMLFHIRLFSIILSWAIFVYSR
jgi:hypothetical protein